MFYGSVIFRFIGTLVRWIVILIRNIILKKPILTFKEVWVGPKSEDPINYASYEFSNILLGMVSLFVFIIVSLYIL